jgi:hypothetical protein
MLPMEALPFVDEHVTQVAASPARTFAALQALVEARLTRPAPAPFVAAWGLEPKSGFGVAEEDPPRLLALRGQHRFSRYELAFEVEEAPDGSTLRARTSAVFPGLAGRAYRGLVIGSGGHGVIVRRMLRSIARAAERASSESSRRETIPG